MKHLLLSLLLLATCALASGQAYVTAPEDAALAETLMQDLHSHAGQEDGDALTVRAARALLGRPYVAGTQEGREERLRIYLTKTDCILFAETCLGLVQTARRCCCQAPMDSLAETIRRTRYSAERTKAQYAPYATRVHYVTEWIRQGERAGYFRDITAELGGIPDTRRIDYMSAHPESYDALKGASQEAKENLRDIRRMEETVGAIPHCYIPKERLAAVEGQIRDGDILCFATSIEGLDYTHVGIAYRQNPGAPLTFIHASSAAGKVIVETRSLQEYLRSRKSATGVTVLRVLP